MGIVESVLDAYRFKDTIIYKENSDLQEKYNALKKLLQEYGDNDDLLSETTYTIIRCKDLASAVSKELIDFLKENHIQIITHTELAELIK